MVSGRGHGGAPEWRKDGAAAPTGRPDSPGPLRRSTPRTRRLEAVAPCAGPPRRRRPGSGTAESHRVLAAAGLGRGNACEFRQGNAGGRQGVADAALDLHVAAVELGAEFGCPAQVVGRGENAEGAAASRQMAVDPVRGLARAANDAEHVRGRKIEDRQPVEDLPAGDAHPVVAAPGTFSGPRNTLIGAHAHGIDQAAAEPGMGLEIAAQLARDWRGLIIACAPPACWIGPFTPFHDTVEQRLAGRNGREDQRYALGNCCLDLGHRRRPFDLAERSVNDDRLFAGNDPRKENRHCLRILAA